MTPEQFLEKLQTHASTFAKAVATNEGEWIIKGFIDVYRRIYTISVDTKIISKVVELLLFPMFVEFAEKQGFKLELCPQQNFYPDLTFTQEASAGDMAQALSLTRPYTNLKTYLEYKERGVDTLRAHEKEIATLAEDEAPKTEEESE